MALGLRLALGLCQMFTPAQPAPPSGSASLDFSDPDNSFYFVTFFF